MRLATNVIWGVVTVFQTGIGCLGNSLLFIVYMYILFKQLHQKRPLDVILIHLTLANTLSATFRGVPYVMTHFGVGSVLEAAGYQALVSVQRGARGACICTSSLLSTFQAIILSPAHSSWGWLKSKIIAQILPLLVYSWVSNGLFNTWVIVSTMAAGNSTASKPIYPLLYREPGRSAFQHAAVFLGVMYVQDFFFWFLMICTSLYMVSVLFSHRKIALRVHSASLSPSSLPETKAAHVVLLLLSCFFFFYGANLCFTICKFFYKKNLRLEMESITSFLASCYPMVCALMLIKYDNRVSRYACAFSNVINFPLLTTGISLASKKYC